ncbi:MAG: YtxH domain-containing protein [Nitrospirae bacterium]|nr:YtxH domain-containing protein [Nitrospirota bacterium]
MMTKKNENGVSGALIAVATLIGSVAGAAVGLLLAPQSGDKTRAKIRESYDSVVENVNAVVKKVDDTLPEFVSKVRTELQDVPDQVKSELLILTKDTEERINKAVEKSSLYLADVKNTISSTFDEGKKTLTSTIEEGKKKMSRNKG